ncbi:MAG TPA: DUF4232 domain-containing protein [Streptosporangiaceae bacterium]|nr:DUF4232 domain-containing protein [Streptosporangiaceae bacterium]
MNLTTRTVRRITAAAAVACAAILVPAIALAAPGSPAGPASPAVVRACETPGLVIWLNTNGIGTAGSVFYHLKFTNLSRHRCTLNGFPFVTAVNLRRHQLGRRASFDHTSVPHVVTLGRGKTARAVLQVVDVSNFPPSACHPVIAAGLRVFPPNQTRSKVIPFPFGACSLRGPVYLTVQPVRK